MTTVKFCQTFGEHHCPFCAESGLDFPRGEVTTWNECHHPELFKPWTRCEHPAGDSSYPGWAPPTWCPLRKGPVTIGLDPEVKPTLLTLPPAVCSICGYSVSAAWQRDGVCNGCRGIEESRRQGLDVGDATPHPELEIEEEDES